MGAVSGVCSKAAQWSSESAGRLRVPCGGKPWCASAPGVCAELEEDGGRRREGAERPRGLGAGRLPGQGRCWVGRCRRPCCISWRPQRGERRIWDSLCGYFSFPSAFEILF